MDLREIVPVTSSRKRGNKYDLDRCPFHNDSRPSLLIWQNYWKCLAGCGKGDGLDFVARHYGVSRNEASKLVGNLPPRIERVEIPRSPPPDLDPSLGLKYHLNLLPKEREYYHWRGLSDETINKFELGYAPRNGQSRFSIPIYKYGKLTGIKFRRDDRCPKCFSPWTEEPPKGEEFFLCLECEHKWIPQGAKYSGIQGHNDARLFNLDAIHGMRRVFIVEGEFDTIMMWQQGFTAVSSTTGANTFLDEWAVHFIDIPLVYVVLDCDAAGIEGSKHIQRVIPKARIVDLGLGDKGDITEFFHFRKLTREDFGKLLRMADRDPRNCLELRLNQLEENIYVE